ALHPLTDHRRSLYLDRKDETIQAPPNFMLVASYNPGYQKGWKEMKPSTRQRFVSISFDYPRQEVEIEIVSEEAKVDKEVAKKLVQLAAKIRNVKDFNLPETVSTRLLVNAGKLIQSGLPTRRACEISIAETLTDETDIIKSIKDLIALIF
ncbi:MAG TPA: CbbQ/NirQ/NorQ C-terminal domain-containing protein, partial [Leptospiraceae bacterium]|nr:CbbQ/NirQ/NorQ C-terminal domain-containing protein [Leptospiraceae bacterium]